MNIEERCYGYLKAQQQLDTLIYNSRQAHLYLDMIKRLQKQLKQYEQKAQETIKAKTSTTTF